MKILLALMMLIFTLNAKSFFSNDNQAEKGKYIMAVKDLIVAAQRTRGVTLSYINGNESALFLIYNYRDDMKTAIGKMESSPLASVYNNKLTPISNAFTRLNTRALKMKSADAFDAYTETIAQALMLAQSVSSTNSDKMNAFGLKVSKVMMEVIMPLSEVMGQQRALGSGASAKGSADKSLKTQMQVLVLKISKLKDRLQSEMRTVVSEKPEYYGPTINSKLVNADNAINEYLKVTKKRIIKNKIDYDANEYFTLATDTISTIMVLFDMNNEAIKEDSKGWI